MVILAMKNYQLNLTVQKIGVKMCLNYMKLAKNKLEKDEPTQPQNDDKELILFKELHPNFTKGYEELSNN